MTDDSRDRGYYAGRFAGEPAPPDAQTRVHVGQDNDAGEVGRLRSLVLALCERVYVQSEILSRMAERKR